MLNDREAPLRFLRTGYEPADWVAVFLKTYRTGETAQRVVSLSEATSPPFQSWLRRRNANSWNVYVSVNAVRPGRSRSRDAICGIRHVFLEEDADGPGLLASLTTRPDLPPPSYVLHSSPGRVHVFWRVRGFDAGVLENWQKITLGTLIILILIFEPDGLSALLDRFTGYVKGLFGWRKEEHAR